MERNKPTLKEFFSKTDLKIRFLKNFQYEIERE